MAGTRAAGRRARWTHRTLFAVGVLGLPAALVPVGLSAQDDPGDALRELYRLPVPTIPEVAGLIVVPTGDLGPGLGRPAPDAALNVFIGASYVRFTRYNNADHDAQGLVGFGVGNPDRWLRLQADFGFYSTVRSKLFRRMGLSVEVSRTLFWDVLLSAGWENFMTRGDPDTGESRYVSLGRWFSTPGRGWLNAVGLSAGAGDGRFVRERDWLAGRTGRINAFGTMALRVAWPVMALASWQGDDLYLAAAFTPFRGIPLVITPGVADVTGRVGNGARFVLSGGYLLRIPLG